MTRHEICHMLGFANGFFVNDAFNTNVDRWAAQITGTTFDQGGLDISLAGASNLGHVLDSGETAGDLMVPAIVNGVRRDISDIDLQMLALAHGYSIIPEPAHFATLLSLAVLGLAIRRHRKTR